MQTEAQLAGVLGHEMGHVIERHTAQQMAKSRLGEMLVVAVGATSDSSYGTGPTNPAVIAALVNKMFQLRYSRHDESEADEWGVKIMTQAGFNPHAMIEVMQVLKAASGDGGEQMEMFQTHPNPDLRMRQIRAYLEKHPPPPGLTEGRSSESNFGQGSYVEKPSQDPMQSLYELFGH